MCAEKVQRFLMGIVLTVCMVLFVQGEIQIAVILQTFVILMVIIWAFTDFCPSLWIFKKIFGSCYDKDNKTSEEA
ncbi:MAG: phosphoribosylaminoimidazole synthetase [Sulfurimonadaceae bacterium]|nr:phosphoribosylaminoimidazole synthetase [Sulfurimonadaceae bacterium]